MNSKELNITEKKQERVSPRLIKGRVVSVKMAKTRVVLIELVKTHPLLGKKLRRSRRIMMHDEKELAKEGDMVLALSSSPISKNKRYRLYKVVTEAKARGGEQ